MMTRAAKRQLLLAPILLTVGGAVYLLLRPRTLLLFRVADGLGFSDQVNQWRSSVSSSMLPEWMVYCLPDALWTTAYLLVIDALLRTEPRCQRMCSAAIIPVVGLLSEVLQWAGLLPGTYDPLDLAAYALPFVCYWLWTENVVQR